MRRFVQAGLAGALALGAVGVLAGPAAAAEYVGPAVGEVVCTNTSITVAFHGSLTNHGGGAESRTVTGTAKDCTVMHPPTATVETISEGVITVPVGGLANKLFTYTPLNCGNPVSVGGTFLITWTGDYTSENHTDSGAAHFATSLVGVPAYTRLDGLKEVTKNGDEGVAFPALGTSVGGSFADSASGHDHASATLYTDKTAATLSSECSGSGMTSLTFTGTLTVGEAS